MVALCFRAALKSSHKKGRELGYTLVNHIFTTYITRKSGVCGDIKLQRRVNIMHLDMEKIKDFSFQVRKACDIPVSLLSHQTYVRSQSHPVSHSL